MKEALDRYRQGLIDRGYDEKTAEAMAVRLRYFWVMRARDGGMTFVSIGKKMGISTSRARDIYYMARRRMWGRYKTDLDRYCEEAPFQSREEIAQAKRFFYGPR